MEAAGRRWPLLVMEGRRCRKHARHNGFKTNDWVEGAWIILLQMQRATSRRDERVWEERQEKRGEPTPDRSSSQSRSRSEREIAMGPSGWGQGSESLVQDVSCASERLPIPG